MSKSGNGYFSWLKASSSPMGASKLLFDIAYKCHEEEKKDKRVGNWDKRARIPKETVIGIKWAFHYGCIPMKDIASTTGFSLNWVRNVIDGTTRSSVEATKEDFKHWYKLYKENPLDRKSKRV